MKKLEFRLLKASEIEVRPGVTKTKGYAELLLFQNSRVAMELLDETFGANWASDYKVLNGVTYCGIAFFNPDTSTYLWRWDCGSPTDIEVEKGTAADAFKRAAVKVGIARELYSAPKIKIQCPDNYYTSEGKFIAKFYVSKIDYDNSRKIKDLVIVDNKGTVVFNYENGKKVPYREPEIDRAELLRIVCSELKRDESNDRGELLRFYNYYMKRYDSFDHWNEGTVRNLWVKWTSKD